VADLARCRPATLALSVRTSGRLTLATGDVTSPPWVVAGPGAPAPSATTLPNGDVVEVGPDPASGLGYDAAVGYALAERLGFDRDDVTWTRVPFTAALAAGDKDWDVHVQQASILPDRRADVDLSVPYHVPRLAFVTRSSSPAAQLDSLDGLRSFTVAVVEGSEAARRLSEDVTAGAVRTYPDEGDLRNAVLTGEADLLLTDTQAARGLLTTAAERLFPDAVVVGQLPRGERPDHAFAMVLEKGSLLTPCVNAALQSLADDGTLDRLERRWLVDEAGWPLLGS
jgi:polar amino acid transport system substrate-binding protein